MVLSQDCLHRGLESSLSSSWSAAPTSEGEARISNDCYVNECYFKAGLLWPTPKTQSLTWPPRISQEALEAFSGWGSVQVLKSLGISGEHGFYPCGNQLGKVGDGSSPFTPFMVEGVQSSQVEEFHQLCVCGSGCGLNVFRNSCLARQFLFSGPWNEIRSVWVRGVWTG